MFLNYLSFGLGVLTSFAGYSCLIEPNQLILRRKKLFLKRWPKEKNGFQIGLISDMHLRDRYTHDLTKLACLHLVHLNPDAIVIAGDFLGYWKPNSRDLLLDALSPLTQFAGSSYAIPGNHDYYLGVGKDLQHICESLGIHFLSNSVHNEQDIQWVGVDTHNYRVFQVEKVFEGVNPNDPCIVLWHEPDFIDQLPFPVDLQISGHTHGGQCTLIGDWPVAPPNKNRKHIKGFYDAKPTPIYVTSGLATTGPPFRFNHPPEIVLLELYHRS